MKSETKKKKEKEKKRESGRDERKEKENERYFTFFLLFASALIYVPVSRMLTECATRVQSSRVGTAAAKSAFLFYKIGRSRVGSCFFFFCFPFFFIVVLCSFICDGVALIY